MKYLNLTFLAAVLSAMSAQLACAAPVVLFKSGDLGYNTFRIPAIAVCTDSTIAVFAEARKNSAADNGRIDTAVRLSSDGGKTWTKPQIILSDDKNSCGNPQPFVDAKTGDLVLLYYWAKADDSEAKIISGKASDRRRAFIIRSHDNAITWSKPREITDEVVPQGRAWFLPGPGGAIQINGGAHNGRIVSAYYTLIKSTRAYRAGAAFSDDGGLTWKCGDLVDYDGSNECQIAQLDADTLAINMRVEGRNPDKSRKTNFRIVSYSTDGGQSWSKAREDTELPEPICQAAFISFAARDGSRRLAFSNPASISKRENMLVRFADAAEYAKRLKAAPEKSAAPVWKNSVSLCKSASGYSDMKQLKNGKIAIVYERGKAPWPCDDIVFETVNPQ